MAVWTTSDKLNFIERLFGAGKLAHNGRDIAVRCPICAPLDRSKKKLAIRVEDDLVHCWVCGFRARSLVTLIKKYGTQQLMNEYRNRFMPVDPGSTRCVFISVDEEAQRAVKLPDDFKLLALASDVDPDVRAVKRYCSSRGLTRDDLWFFKIGVSNEPRWRRRVIVPSFNASGEINYFVARAVDDSRRPKYDNPDVDRVPIIFNEINVDWSKRVVLCEGAFDSFKCGENAVPMLGSDLNEQSALFNAIVAHSTPVVLALDGDMWNTKTPRLASKLMEYDVDVKVVDTREFGDPGSVSKERFRKALDVAKEFTWTTSFFNRLERASKTSMKV